MVTRKSGESLIPAANSAVIFRQQISGLNDCSQTLELAQSSKQTCPRCQTHPVFADPVLAELTCCDSTAYYVQHLRNRISPEFNTRRHHSAAVPLIPTRHCALSYMQAIIGNTTTSQPLSSRQFIRIDETTDFLPKACLREETSLKSS